MYPTVSLPYSCAGLGVSSANSFADALHAPIHRGQEFDSRLCAQRYASSFSQQPAHQLQSIFDPFVHQQMWALQQQRQTCQDQMQALLEQQSLIERQIKSQHDQIYRAQQTYLEPQQQELLAETQLLAKMRQQHARFSQSSSRSPLLHEMNLLARMHQQHVPNVVEAPTGVEAVRQDSSAPVIDRSRDAEQTMQMQVQAAKVREEQEALRRGWVELHEQRESLRVQKLDVDAAEAHARAKLQEPIDKTQAVNAGHHAVAEAPAVVETQPPKHLSLTTDGPWLAQHLHGSGSGEPAKPGVVDKHAKPAVLLGLSEFWPSVWGELPEAKKGAEPMTLNFGLLFGGKCRGGVSLDAAELCPTAFTWEAADSTPCAQVGDLADVLEQDLHRSLDTFLSAVFVPWTAGKEVGFGSPRSAWLVLTDGEAFALPQALLSFGRGASGAAERWRSTVVVADRSKSSAEDAAVEVLALQGPEVKRLLFEAS